MIFHPTDIALNLDIHLDVLIGGWGPPLNTETTGGAFNDHEKNFDYKCLRNSWNLFFHQCHF